MIRPYISDNGARNNGPNAYPSTNTDIEVCISTSLVISKFSAMAGNAGEMIVEDIRVARRKQDMRSVTAHLSFIPQFFGFMGSVALSQVTCISSALVFNRY